MNMQPKWTAGEWRLADWSYEDGKRIVPTIQNDKDAIAQVLDLWCPDDRKEEMAANGKLLTAAPQMANTLRAIFDCYGVGGTVEQFARNVAPLIDEAREVLSKAGAL